MRKKFWPILLAGMIVCGSIFILPRFLYYIIIHELSHISHVTVPECDSGEYALGQVLLHAAHISLYKDVQLVCERLSIKYNAYDIVLSPYSIIIYGNNCLLHSSKSENNILGLNELSLENICAQLSIKRGKGVYFDECITEGDFGRCVLTGSIKDNKYIDINVALFLQPEFLQQVPLPLRESLDDIQQEYEISISVTGILPYPDIDISSQHFNLTLKSNE